MEGRGMDSCVEKYIYNIIFLFRYTKKATYRENESDENETRENG